MLHFIIRPIPVSLPAAIRQPSSPCLCFASLHFRLSHTSLLVSQEWVSWKRFLCYLPVSVWSMNSRVLNGFSISGPGGMTPPILSPSTPLCERLRKQPRNVRASISNRSSEAPANAHEGSPAHTLSPHSLPTCLPVRLPDLPEANSGQLVERPS